MAKSDWERAKDALETVLKFVPLEKVERLAEKLEDPDFRKSLAFRMFIKNL